MRATLALITLGFLGTGAVALFECRKLAASDGAANDRYGVAVSVNGDTAIAGAYLDDDSGSNAGSAYVLERGQGGPNTWGEVVKLSASDPDIGDWFGYAVALSGDTAVVGAYGDDEACPPFISCDSGAAYVFSRNAGGAANWGEVAKLLASDAAPSDEFGRTVAIHGDFAVVGAYLDDDQGQVDAGAAYVFARNAGGPENWGQVAKLRASDANGGDWFGRSVAISGGLIVVGANLDDDGGSGSGSAYVFALGAAGPSDWNEEAKLTASDGSDSDWFGETVAIHGITAIVGAPFHDDTGSDSGAAYVFGRNQGGLGNWGEVAKLTPCDAAALDRFGAAVSIHGDLAVVGAHGNDDACPANPNCESGSAYAFARDAGGPDNWGEVRKLAASDAAIGDRFGWAVSIDGATTLIGAQEADVADLDSGSVYVFEMSASVQAVRLGVPPNPAALLPGQTSGPVIGRVWDPVIDHSTFLPGAVGDLLIGTFLPTNLPFGALGTILCDVTLPTVYIVGVPGAPFRVRVPMDCSLIGATLCVQGASADATEARLTNALDITFGSF